MVLSPFMRVQGRPSISRNPGLLKQIRGGKGKVGAQNQNSLPSGKMNWKHLRHLRGWTPAPGLLIPRRRAAPAGHWFGGWRNTGALCRTPARPEIIRVGSRRQSGRLSPGLRVSPRRHPKGPAALAGRFHGQHHLHPLVEHLASLDFLFEEAARSVETRRTDFHRNAASQNRHDSQPAGSLGGNLPMSFYDDLTHTKPVATGVLCPCRAPGRIENPLQRNFAQLAFCVELSIFPDHAAVPAKIHRQAALHRLVGGVRRGAGKS